LGTPKGTPTDTTLWGAKRGTPHGGKGGVKHTVWGTKGSPQKGHNRGGRTNADKYYSRPG